MTIFSRIEYRYECHQSRGFTLVEILVVMIIVGIMAGLAVLSIGGNPQRELQQEARRIQTVLSTAYDEALMQGKEYGFMLNETNYHIAEFDIQARQWIPSNLKAFASYQLPETMRLSLSIEDEPVDLIEVTAAEDEDKKDKNDNTESVPELIFFSSGEATAFTLSLTHQDLDNAFELRTDGIEEVRLEVVDD